MLDEIPNEEPNISELLQQIFYRINDLSIVITNALDHSNDSDIALL